MSKTYYNVRPRYTAGSPAMVDCVTAKRVAEQEKEAHEVALTGTYGERDKALAERCGLRGIAEEVIERRSHWEVLDLCTGERLERLFPDKLRKQGYKQFDELQDWERKLVNECNHNLPDVTKGWFKVEVGPFQTFPTGYQVIVYREKTLNL